jgi:integrase/recombinase XerC
MTAALHPDCLRFLEYLRYIRKYSPHTIHNYQKDLIKLSELFAATPPSQVNTAQIRKLTNQLHSQQLHPRSIARHLSCWRSFFSWLSLHSDVRNNPVVSVKAPKQNKNLPKALSVDEAVHLVGTPSGDQVAQLADHAMFELLYSSGLRVSELTHLDVAYCKEADYASLGWIDLSDNMVHVTGKGNKSRGVPIGSAAANALQTWLKHRPQLLKLEKNALFLTQRGTRISPRSVQLRMKAHAQKLGFKSNVHPHVLRHSFASHLLQSSGDLRAVQELLGHASITSTQLYTALDFQHLAQVYDAAHPRAKIK